MKVGLTLLVALMVATSCSSEKTPESDGFTPVAKGICDALNVDDDAGEMEAIFDDEVHSGVHDMVAVLEDDYRDIAGDVLVAKNRVETSLEDQEPPVVLKSDFSNLLLHVQDGLRALDMEVPTCTY